MEGYKTNPRDVVPLGQKIAFGSGSLTNQLFPAALGVFMIVLVLSLKMNPPMMIHGEHKVLLVIDDMIENTLITVPYLI